MPNTIRNSKAGLDIVTYTGNGGGQFIGTNANKGIPASNYTQTVPRSLRFRAAQGTRLDISFGAPFSTAGHTFSCWIKKTTNGVAQNIFGVDANNKLGFNSSDQLVLTLSGAAVATSTVVFKDTSRWMHVHYYQNGTTAGLVVDSQLVASSGAATNTVLNRAGTHRLGCADLNDYFDGYMAFPLFSDGQSLNSTIAADMEYRAWIRQPLTTSQIRTNIGFGNNGFFYMFNETPSTTTVLDRKGADGTAGTRPATCTNVGISGVDTDWVNDTPTNNLPTVDSIPALSLFTLTRGALTLTHNATASADGTVLTQRIPPGGKYYLEVTCTSGTAVSLSAHLGILSDGLGTNIDPIPNIVGYWGLRIDSTLRLCINGVETTTAYTVPVNGVLQIAIDCDNKRIYFGTDNTWRTAANITGAAFNAENFAYYGDLTGKRICLGGIKAVSFEVNTGHRAFTFTPPTNFVSLGSQNLPSIDYQANNPDLWIIKNRDASASWVWSDYMRGRNAYVSSDATTSEGNDFNVINPYPVKRGCVYVGNDAKVNTLDQKYVAYGFSAGQRAVVNLLQYSQDPANAVWNKNSGSVTIGAAVTAPDGTTTAKKLIEANDVGVTHCIIQSGISILDLHPYACSVYVKAAGRTKCRVVWYTTGGVYGDFDLTTGVTTAQAWSGGSSAWSSMHPVGNGWYRLIVGGIAATGTSGQIQIDCIDASGNVIYNGDGTSGLYVWGAQVEAGWSANDYIRNEQTVAWANFSKRQGLSIIAYTGNSTAGTKLGHGLGTAPKFGIVFCRGVEGTNYRAVYHASLGATKCLYLNRQEGFATNTTWNNTTPEHDVVTLGGTGLFVNTTGYNYISYWWSEVLGYSKFGSFIGNAADDGPYIHLGFTPKFVLIKNADATVAWEIHDNVRSTYNPSSTYLGPYSAGAEGTIVRLDFTSQGFKIRSLGSTGNGSGNQIVYAAFAEVLPGDFFTPPSTAR